MHLSEDEITAIRESLKWLMPEAERVAPKFYEGLFRRDPELRKMFRDDLAEQGMRFISAVRTISDHLGDPEALDRTINLLAEGHAAMNIDARSYHTMEEALIDTFREALGARLSSEMQLAWRRAFRQIGEAMMARSGTDPNIVSPVTPLN